MKDSTSNEKRVKMEKLRSGRRLEESEVTKICKGGESEED